MCCRRKTDWRNGLFNILFFCKFSLFSLSDVRTHICKKYHVDCTTAASAVYYLCFRTLEYYQQIQCRSVQGVKTSCQHVPVLFCRLCKFCMYVLQFILLILANISFAPIPVFGLQLPLFRCCNVSWAHYLIVLATGLDRHVCCMHYIHMYIDFWLLTFHGFYKGP